MKYSYTAGTVEELSLDGYERSGIKLLCKMD
jgi:hypothetical protein